MPTLETIAAGSGTQTNPTLTLEITRIIAAPRPRVFEAWTRPEIIRQWFAPGPMAVPAAETDPVEGGSYTIQMQGTLEDCVAKRPSESRNYRATIRGTYRKVSPFDLLQFTWTADWAPEETSLVTVCFSDVDEGTELRLIHEQFAATSSRDAHHHGWSGSLNNLAALSL